MFLVDDEDDSNDDELEKSSNISKVSFLSFFCIRLNLSIKIYSKYGLAAFG